MLSTAHVEKQPNGWVARVDLGFATATHGPFRWKWVARIVAWLNVGDH